MKPVKDFQSMLVIYKENVFYRFEKGLRLAASDIRGGRADFEDVFLY
jgi:hypothetical protein